MTALNLSQNKIAANAETIPEVNLLDPAFKANPYPTYAALRSAAPVHRVTLPEGQSVWLITRYDDVVTVLKDDRFVKDWRNAKTPEQIVQIPHQAEVLAKLDHNLLKLDPPDHTRLRALVHKAFTPHLVAGLRDRIQTIADTLLDAVQAKGKLDLIADYAFPLPIIVIAELLGVPAEDRDKFRAWSDMAVSTTSYAEVEKTASAMLDFTAYLGVLFEARRAAPQDDLISALVLSEEVGDKLTEDELFAMVYLLLVAGHETTVNLIGNGTLALLQHPDQLARLKADPTLIESAIEELLRYDGPVETSTGRYASEDIAIGGAVIPRGEMVFVVIGSADHDPEQFPNPETLDIGRDIDRHVAFGMGPHYCLGAPLARLEGRIAINTLLRRLPNLRLEVAPETLSWKPGLVLRGLHTLPLIF
ncbi:MAG: cytochrome P450 [Anaerolineae bacterium]|nr:cytochrome P450 [Anaerolineae bacterium]